MNVFVKSRLAGVAWALIAVAAAIGPVRADPVEPSISDAAKPADVSRSDFSAPSPEERGSAEAADPPAATTPAVDPPSSSTRLNLIPDDADAPASLARSPLPPDAPPLPSSALLIPFELPPAPAALAPRPGRAPASSGGPAARVPPTRAAPLAALAPPPVELASPERSATTSPDLGGAVDVASAALMIETANVNPLGSGDWRAARAAIRVFYAERAFAPVWTDEKGLTPAGLALLRRLLRAPEDGVDLGGLAPPAPTFAEVRPAKLAEAETTLSAAAVVYALQASGSRIVPSRLSNFVSAKPVLPDPVEVLRDIARANAPGDALAAYNPGQKGYRDLRDELARLRESAAPLAGRPSTGPTLKVGMEDARVPLIRARFGLGAAADPANARVYDRRVATAVAAFQRMKGLSPDGALTTATEEALFGDPNARRESAILANMEMWRWEPRDMGEARIEINVPDFALQVMDGDDEVRSARVIVGKPDTPTPIFSNEIKYILRQSDLARAGFDHQEGNAAQARRRSRLSHASRLPGQPGRRSAGRQPAARRGQRARPYPLHVPQRTRGLSPRHADARPVRDFAARLQPWLRARRTPDAARRTADGRRRARLDGAKVPIAARKRRADRSFFRTPLPIHIEYFTEFVDASGAPQEREDVYGLTGQVAATLSRLRQD